MKHLATVSVALAMTLLSMASSRSAFTQTDSISTSPDVQATAAAAQSQAHRALTACRHIDLGQQASLNGFVPFPTTDPWRQSVAAAPVSPTSAAVIAEIGNSGLHPDFGAGDSSVSYGIPYNVVSDVASTPIHYQAYGDESDPGPMPIPASTTVEGYPNLGQGGDQHVLVIDRNNCFLYELFNAQVQGDGSWNADSGAIWDLANDNDRPYTWTSADAAGLPIFPGLVRYDEVASGAINHALRFTLNHTSAGMIAPATHYAASVSNFIAPPMGTRLRLKASFDISGFSPQAKVVLQALQTYGMILADNGSNMFVSGTSDNRWDNDDLHNLSQVPASAFEVVSAGTPITNNSLPVGAAPVITTLRASRTTIAAGEGARLVWDATDASYFLMSPLGALRGHFIDVHPTQTTTYTLYATNHFGRTSQSITITVQ